MQIRRFYIPTLAAGEVTAELGSIGETTTGCWILYDGQEVAVRHATLKNGKVNFWRMWYNGVNKWQSDGFDPYGFYASEGYTDGVGDMSGICFTSCNRLRYNRVSGKYRFISTRCGTSLNGKMYALLTGMDGNPNLVVAGESVRPAGVKGILTGLEVRLEERTQSSQ